MSSLERRRAPRPKPDPRYEKKYVVPETDALASGLDLELFAQGYRAHYPDRIVQSVYLDGPDRRALEDNLSGIGNREKLRLRWYGKAARGVTGTLERKVREAGLGWKESARVPGALDVERTPRHGFAGTLAARLPAEWSEHLAASCEPAQWVRYRRTYLLSPDGYVRLTIDRELACFDQRRRPILSATGATGVGRPWIVELKCALEHGPELAELAGRLPLVVDRCSKFALAEDPTTRPRAVRTLRRGW